MAPLIRSAAIAENRHRLRLGRALAAEESTPLSAPPPVAEVKGLSALIDGAAAAAEKAVSEEEIRAEIRTEVQAELETTLHHELETARQEAEQQGYAAGYARGVAEAHEVQRTKHEHLAKMVEMAGSQFVADIDGLEDVAVGIAFAAVCRILGSALVTPEGVRAVVGEVVKQAKESEKLLVRLAPGDFYLLLQQRSGEAGERASSNIELVPDDRVALGGCIVETSGGSLDGRLESQLESLRTTLLQVRRERAGGEPSL